MLSQLSDLVSPNTQVAASLMPLVSQKGIRITANTDVQQAIKAHETTRAHARKVRQLTK
jgi:hypothetical protein